MTTYTEKASWFYKPIHIENLEEIQKELTEVIYKKVPDFDNSNPMFLIIFKNDILPYAPLYVKFIESLGLLDKWVASPIITTNKNIKFPIHIDNPNWLEGSYGLNIPVINCEDTYTVWYDAEVDQLPGNRVPSDPSNRSRFVTPGTPTTEIARWHMKDPAWINFSIPHKPVSNHGKPRAVMSARFRPELHDLLHK